MPLRPWNQNKLCQTVHSSNTTQSYPTAVYLHPKWCPCVPSQQAISRMPCCSILHKGALKKNCTNSQWCNFFHRPLIASSKRLLAFNSLSELVLQAANASFLCIAVRADVLLDSSGSRGGGGGGGRGRAPPCRQKKKKEEEKEKNRPWDSSSQTTAARCLRGA